MAISPTNLPSIASGLTSGFTTSYLDLTSNPPNTFPMTTYSWAPVQAIIDAGIDFYNLPTYTLINLNVLKSALRQRYITMPKNYRSGQIPYNV